MLLKYPIQYASKFGKLNSGHSGKNQFSFQSQRKAIPKIAQTTAQLHSSHTLAKYCSKFSKPGFTVRELKTSRYESWIEKRQRNQRSNCQHLLNHRKSKSSRKTFVSALLTMPKPLTVDHNKVLENFQEMGIPDHLTCLLRNLYAGTKQKLELDMEQQTGSK